MPLERSADERAVRNNVRESQAVLVARGDSRGQFRTPPPRRTYAPRRAI
jgi:hypothetical protein